MEEIYEIISNKIRESGYEPEVDGREIYDEICDNIEGRENGSYIFMTKPFDDTVFEYNVQIFDEDFNLSTITITKGDKIYKVNFDDWF